MIKCSYCQQSAKILFSSKDYNRRISTEIFTYYRCEKCELIFTSPIPSNLGDYYPNDYYPTFLKNDNFESIFAPEKYKLEIVQKFITKGRLLEIGPGGGGFTYLAKQSGFNVEAIEMSEDSCKFLRDIIQINVIQSNDIIQALMQRESYKVIALWHVLEHLIEPWKTLETISKKILPEGILVLALPNPEAFQFHLFGKFWPHLDAPRHIMLIPNK